jgi:tetratricopeptide (TPR) repeat protein
MQLSRSYPLLIAAEMSLVLCTSWGQQSNSAASAPVLLRQGAALAISGRVAEAEIPLLQAAEAEPNNIAVISELAKVEGRLGKNSRAIELFRRAVSMTRSDPELHLDLGLALADNNEMNEALLEISTALKLDPKLAKGFLVRAQIFSDLKRFDDAAKDLSTATQQDPHLAKAWYYWATLEMQRDNYAKASGLLEHAIRIEPENTTYLTLLGQCLTYQSRHAAAVEAWRRVLAIDPDDPKTTYLLSQALRRSDPTESSRLLARFHSMHDRQDQIDRQMESIKILGNRGVEAMHQQDWPSAMNYFKQAISMCGQCTILGDLEKNLGLAACHSWDLDTGQRELTEALRLKPADSDIVVALRWIQQQQKIR